MLNAVKFIVLYVIKDIFLTSVDWRFLPGQVFYATDTLILYMKVQLITLTIDFHTSLWAEFFDNFPAMSFFKCSAN